MTILKSRIVRQDLIKMLIKEMWVRFDMCISSIIVQWCWRMIQTCWGFWWLVIGDSDLLRSMRNMPRQSHFSPPWCYCCYRIESTDCFDEDSSWLVISMHTYIWWYQRATWGGRKGFGILEDDFGPQRTFLGSDPQGQSLKLACWGFPRVQIDPRLWTHFCQGQIRWACDLSWTLLKL